jgi:hypothetical protein
MISTVLVAAILSVFAKLAGKIAPVIHPGSRAGSGVPGVRRRRLAALDVASRLSAVFAAG